MKASAIILLTTLFLVNCNPKTVPQKRSINSIKSDFIKPVDTNSIWCYWYWIGDDISKEGITKDLEAMKKVGIGGALIGNINPDEIDGKVPMLSEGWWDHMVHAVNEGKRIGVDIGSFNCPGWSQSGGPWVKSDMAMRFLNYSEIKISGSKQININLEKPKEEFQDVYVLAFPSLEAENNKISSTNSKIKISPEIENQDYLLDNDFDSAIKFKGDGTNYTVKIKSDKPITARSILIYPGIDNFKAKCELLVIENGEKRSLKSFVFDRSNNSIAVGAEHKAPVAVALPETNSNEYQLIVSDLTFEDGAEAFAEIVISESEILEDYVEKHLGKMHPTPFPKWDSYHWAEQNKVKNANLKVQSDEVIDLSTKMDSNGNLIWNAPAGNWTIQRYGMTPTGTQNSPSAPQGKGYEVDKASKKLIRYHFENFIGEFLKRIPEESKSAFKYVIADSYEMGSQNWTEGFEAKFENRYGYNPKKYLPVFSGRIVGSVAESDRFLWDLRRLVADAVAYEYTGGLREISNENNLKLWLENYGHWGFPSEFLMYGGQSDLVAGEFWNEGTLGDIECKSASSAAHIYGKRIVSAEAFTAAQRTYVRHPALLKKRGDWSFTEGINHFVLHLYVQQPDENRIPGVNAWFSTEFNRHNTWFDKSTDYFNYLRRCQHLLQQGKYAADVLYFIGEGAPIMTGSRNPEIPDGYSYDYINAEVIQTRLKVEDGRFVLPDGMSYGMMVLPPITTMRPELLEKLESLVSQGGKIFGHAPEKSPSLENYPESDEQVKSIALKMWGTDNEKIRQYGDGIIAKNMELQDALKKFGLEKDVDLEEDIPVLWTHRTSSNMEIYFLTNQSDQEINFSPSFNVKNLHPVLWDAMTGEIRALNDFKEVDGRTIVPIKLTRLQSCFIVFTKNKDSSISDEYNENFPQAMPVKTINETWKVDFLNKNIGPNKAVEFNDLTDWIDHNDDRIKFYSGNAVYSTSFEYSKNGNEGETFIDLGDVGVMASVKLNGKDLGTTWIAPFRLNLKDALKEGINNLEVEVVNVWRNRLTGDKTLPEKDKTTWLLVDDITKDEELLSSGLKGPVCILQINNNR